MKRFRKIEILLAAAAILCVALAAIVIAVSHNSRQASSDNGHSHGSSDEGAVSDYVETNTALHMAYFHSDDEAAREAYANGSVLYTCMKFTGTALADEQIYNIREMESLMEFDEDLGLFGNESLQGETEDSYTGIRFLDFLEYAGLAEDAADDVVVDFYYGVSDTGYSAQKTAAFSLTLAELEHSEVAPMIVFGVNGVPLVAYESSDGYVAKAGNANGPMALLLELDGECQLVNGIKKVLVSNADERADPHYSYHNHGLFTAMQNVAFTCSLYDVSGNSTSYTFTTAELEELETEHPEAVAGNYFATNGNVESAETYGDVGGFMDYYEGFRLDWLISYVTGLEGYEDAYAVFYDRDGTESSRVDNLSYFWGKDGDFSQYYSLSRDFCQVYGCVPILGIAKNGYPQLPEHNHEAEAYVAKNNFGEKLVDMGFTTEFGVVINITGPFTSCTPNLDGVYGGYQITTGSNCGSMEIYLRN